MLNKKIVGVLRDSKIITQVAVSLDGENPKTHESFRGVKGCFLKTINGIKLLKEFGINTQIIMSLHKGNINEIEGLINLAVDLRVNSFKINPIMPSGRGDNMFMEKKTLSVKEIIELNQYIEKSLIDKYNIKILLCLPLAFRPIKYFKDKDFGICGILNIAGVLSNGDVSICGIGKQEKELVMGNIKKDNIQTIWENGLIFNQIRKDIPKNLEGVCGKCILKVLCLGSCVANNYYLERRLNAPYWFCQEAYEKGLFPSSRLI